MLGSFDYKILRELRAAVPQADLVVIHSWSGVIATRRARRLDTKNIAMNHKWLWGGFIKSIVKGGYELTAYTLNNPTKARRWQKIGLHAVVTDYPDNFS